MAVFGIPPGPRGRRPARGARGGGDPRGAGRRSTPSSRRERGIAIRFRTGVNTGEVVAGDPATRDNARHRRHRQHRGPPGAGGPTGRDPARRRLTYTLVRDAVEAEAVEPIAAEGQGRAGGGVPPRLAFGPASRAAPATSTRRWSGASASSAASTRPSAAPSTDRTCQLFTLLGPAGVGKSRLTAEFLRVDRRRGDASSAAAASATARASRTGPIAELVRGGRGHHRSDDSEDAASARCERCSATRRRPTAREPTSARRSACPRRAVPGRAIFWAVRRLLERLADDAARWSSSSRTSTGPNRRCWTCSSTSRTGRATCRCSCCAPPAPSCWRSGRTWAAGRGNATTLRLEPLGSDATRRLIEDLPGGPALPRSVVERVVATADGNPLFVEELLAMFVDEGVLRAGPDGAWQSDESTSPMYGSRRRSAPCSGRGSRFSAPRSA